MNLDYKNYFNLFFILKNYVIVSVNGSLICNIDENLWGKIVFVDGINIVYGYNWYLGRWYCECIRKL